MILVAYASRHGSTEEMARFMADRFLERGRDAQARSVDAISDLGDPEAVILGSAVYAGSWMKEATDFALRQRDALASVPVWLFSTGPLGAQVQDEEEQPRQLAELRDSLDPREHRIFFGALDLGKLGFGERMIAKAVKAPEGDFRDWGEIGAWVDAITDELDAPRSAKSPEG